MTRQLPSRIAALLLCHIPAISSSIAKEPPNIVFILADDLGITDIGAYARHFTAAKADDLFFETPHLDRLAAEGISFSQAYANQLCSPTRAAILTGRIASRLGVTTATPNTRTFFNQGMEPPAGFDPHDVVEHMDPIPGKRPWRNATSNTALDPAIPAWPRVLDSHDCAFLGKWHLGGHGVPERQPAAFGFEELAFFDSGGSPYFKWHAQWNRTNPSFPTQPGKFRIGTAGEPTGKDYLTDDLNARAVAFIKARRAVEKPFVLYYAPFAVHTPFHAPQDEVKRFSAKKQRGHLGRDNATYAAMLKRLDDSVGAIRKTLEETGLSQNTVLIFTSDNGGVTYTDPPATNNHPFKGGKAMLYEGGVRVPAIVWQPGRFEGGKWCDAVIDCTDYLPTVAELTGNNAPADIDGRSILPLLENPESPGPERIMVWHYPFNVSVKHPDNGEPLPPHSAIRVGPHKLIWNWHGTLELYDIPADPFEHRDLAKEKPELTAQLHRQLKDWLKANVAPRYWPQRDETIPDDSPNSPVPFLLSSAAEKPNIILIFTDDHGYADLSCQGYESDIITPHLDRMAREGARFTDGYVTAPQCCPSRAGILTGRDQNRFGFHSNGHGPLPLSEKTIADHLGSAGYTTGMVGKWHLEPNHSDRAFLEKHSITNGKIPAALQAPYHPHARGFRETFFGHIHHYSVTYDLEGKRFDKPRPVKTTGDRIDRQSEAALRFIDLHHDKPFFLYLAYYAPHVPLASSAKYIARFPGDMPERRRLALAMLSAIDDGVGGIMGKLDHYGIDDKTLMFFIGDNGAPLKLTMKDYPVHLDGAHWDGSKNTPLNGEKGMLAEGGIRVPYLMRWKGTIPPGQVIHTPVTTLDTSATAIAAARIKQPASFDGSNLLPLLVHKTPLPERTLHWRFWKQSAARQGDWKLLKLSEEKSFLFNLSKDKEEKNNLAGQHPDIVQRLESSLKTWATQLTPKGLPKGELSPQEKTWYQHFFQHP